MARRSSDRLRVAEPPRFRRACRRRRARHNQRRSPCRDPQVESCPNCRCHGDVPAGVSKQSNNSSNNLPNHASNTPISASVTGTSSGQSSVTVHIVRSRFARRAGSLRSLCRFFDGRTCVLSRRVRAKPGRRSCGGCAPCFADRAQRTRDRTRRFDANDPNQTSRRFISSVHFTRVMSLGFQLLSIALSAGP